MRALSYTSVLLFITFSAIPVSRSFQWWSPPDSAMFAGAAAAMFSLPLMVKLFARGPSGVLNLATFFSIFMFASAIDLVVSLENDGIMANYMSFYLRKGEPYLTTEYSTAICYWDAVIHYILYWIMLNDFSKGNDRFRSVSLYWFGSFFISVVILMLGSLTGPFPVYTSILLNLPYGILPVIFLYWVLTSTKHHQAESIPFSTCTSGTIVQLMFSLFFLLFTALALLRGLVALNAERDVVYYYGSHIEQPIIHDHSYGRITVLVYLFYGIPFYAYALFCLLRNSKSLALVDASMLYAGLAANAQVGYLGPFLRESDDYELQFEQNWMRALFWVTNVFMFIVPQVFAIYCYNCYPSSDKRKER